MAEEGTLFWECLRSGSPLSVTMRLSTNGSSGFLEAGALGGSEVFVFKVEQNDLVLVHKMKSWPR